MSHVAVITARGGSKRVPGKNIKDFCGKPILAYSIQAALDSGLYDEVMVSTDSEEIAAIARQYGAAVPFMRSAATADDYATTRDVLLEVLAEYEKRGRTFDLLTCIYPTAPFVTARKLQEATALLEGSDAEGVQPVAVYSVPAQWAMKVADGRLYFRYPEYRNARSQDLEPSYYDPGQFYVFRTATYVQHAPDEGGMLPYLLPETEVQDLDTPTDWVLAELKYQAYIKRQGV